MYSYVLTCISMPSGQISTIGIHNHHNNVYMGVRRNGKFRKQKVISQFLLISYLSVSIHNQATEIFTEIKHCSYATVNMGLTFSFLILYDYL